MPATIPRAPDPLKGAYRRRLAGLARDLAATAEVLSLTIEHLSHDAEREDTVRAQRLCSRAEYERGEARRLWELADELES